MDKNALEQLMSSYNFWMGVSTIAVAVGILGEYIAHFVFEKEARKNTLAVVVSIVFGAVVLGGVVGEYLCGTKLSQASDRLQRIADKEVADANRIAASAKQAAEDAKKASSENNQRAAVALQNAEDARAEARKFQLQIAQANERAAEAQKETAKLTQRFADRTLTDNQLKTIADKIRPYAGQQYDISAYWDLKETMALVQRIYDGLNFAGWKYMEPQQRGMQLGGLAGVQVWVHPDASSQIKSAASALIAALNAEGIDSELRLQNPKNPPDPKIHLSFGTKP